MKTKYILIYTGLGIAFLAVSLWVLLSGGRSAKAVRAKFRLGGAMLTTWALLSASVCQGCIPIIACYEPISNPAVTCLIGGVPMESGTDVLSGNIIYAVCDKRRFAPEDTFRIEIKQGETILQSCRLVEPIEEDDEKAVYSIVLDFPAGTTGCADVVAIRMVRDGNDWIDKYWEKVCRIFIVRER